MSGLRHPLSYLYFITVHLSSFTLYKYVCPDSSVLCFALRSSQIECVSIQDSPSELELSLKIQPYILLSVFSVSVMYSGLYLMYPVTHHLYLI